MVNRGLSNSPVVCWSANEAAECARASGRLLNVVRMGAAASAADWPLERSRILEAVRDASEAGHWCCIVLHPSFCDARTDAGNVLRDVVQAVWLKGHWMHHVDFRCWIAVGGADGQRDDAPPPAADYLSAWVSQHAYFLMSVSSILPRYRPDDYAREFDVRELTSAVTEGAVVRAVDCRHFVLFMRPADVVEMFRAAMNEAAFRAVIDASNPQIAKHVASARDAEGYSVLDAAISRNFKDAAVEVRNIGGRSERFNFDLLLDPAFEPLLQALLDPEKPLPFDGVRSAATIALSGRADLLRKLFECGTDVHFRAADYPLCEAATTNSMAVVYTVIDRMAVTGVHPFRDGRHASAHVRRILSYGDGTAAWTPATEWTLERLCQCIIADETRTEMTLSMLQRAKPYPRIMSLILSFVDPSAFPPAETGALLEFFTEFDPGNPIAIGVALKAVDDLVAPQGNPSSADNDREQITMALVLSMIRSGPRAAPLLDATVSRTVSRGQLNLVRRDSGATVFMRCFDLPINLAAAEILLAHVMSGEQRAAMLEQSDGTGCTALQRLVVDASQRPDAFADIVAGQAVDLLLRNGALTAARPPRFPTSLFGLCARHDLTYMAIPLFLQLRRQVAKPPSVILSFTQNAIALIANQSCDALEGQTIPPPLAAIDQRCVVPPRSSMRLPLRLLGLCASYLTPTESSAMQAASVRCFFAALLDVAWPYELPPLGPRTAAATAVKSAVLAPKSRR